MKDEKYPKDFQDFFEVCKDEAACCKYLFEMRWPEGFVCHEYCMTTKCLFTTRNTIRCSVCDHQTSLTYGTLFQDTKKPLLLWFHIIMVGCSVKNSSKR